MGAPQEVSPSVIVAVVVILIICIIISTICTLWAERPDVLEEMGINIKKK